MTEYSPEGGLARTEAFGVGLCSKRRQFLPHAAQGVAADVTTIRLQVCTEELHSLTDRADAHLTLMKREVQLFFKKPPNPRNNTTQCLTAAADNKEVIHIAAIVTASERAFHEVIETTQIDVAEELAGEVADG